MSVLASKTNAPRKTQKQWPTENQKNAEYQNVN